MKLNQPTRRNSAWLSTIGWQLISLAADERADECFGFARGSRELPRLSPTDEVKSFKDEAQYQRYLNTNYHPGLQSFSEKMPDVVVNTPATRKLKSEYDKNNDEMTGLVRSSFDNPSPEASSRWSQLYGRQKDIESQLGK